MGYNRIFMPKIKIPNFSESIKQVRRYTTPPRPVRFLLVTLLVAMCALTLVRLTLLLRNLDLVERGVDGTMWLATKQMFNGIRFDLAYLAKVWLGPLVVTAIAQYVPRYARYMGFVTLGFICFIMSISLMIAIGNIPYFEYFHNHVNAMALKYMINDMGQATSMVVGDSGYLTFAIISIVASALFCYVVIRLARRYQLGVATEARRHALIYILVISAIVPLADRGFIFKKHTLKPADCMICNTPFINKLAINPVEPFIISVFNLGDLELHLIDSKHAAEYVYHEMGRGDSFTEHIEAKESPWRNLVIVMMESTSSERMAYEGSTKGITPTLDRLATEGVYFENTYSTDTHTCNAIYSVITSMPSYVDLHPMQDGSGFSLNTIYEQITAMDDMETIFIITHEPNFDNVRGFVTTQGFDRLISAEDYPNAPDRVWGVDDHVMFERAIKEFDNIANSGRRFAGVCLTCSNHIPYNIPSVSGFNPKSSKSNIEDLALEYSDWSLGHFFDLAKECSWFDDTLFVVVGDHGSACTVDFEVSEGFNHIPLIFYSPAHLAPEVRSELVSQMDITPTAMAMLGLEHDNHTMGIDLNKTTRRMIPYGADGHIAARDEHWIYNYDAYNDIDFLYNLDAEGNERYINVAKSYPEIVELMYEYVASMTQAGWDMHNNPKLIEDQK